MLGWFTSLCTLHDRDNFAFGYYLSDIINNASKGTLFLFTSTVNMSNDIKFISTMK